MQIARGRTRKHNFGIINYHHHQLNGGEGGSDNSIRDVQVDLNSSNLLWKARTNASPYFQVDRSSIDGLVKQDSPPYSHVR